jgi:hypothetical protein
MTLYLGERRYPSDFNFSKALSAACLPYLMPIAVDSWEICGITVNVFFPNGVS